MKATLTNLHGIPIISSTYMGSNNTGRNDLFLVAHGFVQLLQTESKSFPGPSN